MKSVLLTFLAIFLTGCGSKAPDTRPNAAPDNTKINTRDRDQANKTPIDQNENQKDVDITANIRKRVVDGDFSVNGKNCKIITQDGRVTLRGPVKSTEEKQRIADIAVSVAGATNVDNQLEAAP